MCHWSIDRTAVVLTFLIMPMYEYECSRCQKVHEVIQKFSDAPLEACPDCQGALTKLMSRSSFSLKGSGWYSTDYRRSSQPKTEETSNPSTSATAAASTTTVAPAPTSGATSSPTPAPGSGSKPSAGSDSKSGTRDK